MSKRKLEQIKADIDSLKVGLRTGQLTVSCQYPASGVASYADAVEMVDHMRKLEALMAKSIPAVSRIFVITMYLGGYDISSHAIEWHSTELAAKARVEGLTTWAVKVRANGPKCVSGMSNLSELYFEAMMAEKGFDQLGPSWEGIEFEYGPVPAAKEN